MPVVYQDSIENIYISIKKKIIGTKMKIGQLEDGNSNLLLYFYNLIVRIKE